MAIGRVGMQTRAVDHHPPASASHPSHRPHPHFLPAVLLCMTREKAKPKAPPLRSTLCPAACRPCPPSSRFSFSSSPPGALLSQTRTHHSDIPLPEPALPMASTSGQLLCLPAAAAVVLLFISSAPLVALASEPLNPEGNAVRPAGHGAPTTFDLIHCPSGF